MKKSHLRLILFDILLVTFLFLNSFILNIFNYYNLIFFLIMILVIFKFVFGFERPKALYLKDILSNIAIVLLLIFLIYYLFGLKVGFVRSTNYYSVYGFFTFIFPYVIYIIFREYLRFQMIEKIENYKILFVLTFFVFLLFDVANSLSYKNMLTVSSRFMFYAFSLFPAISTNITSMYICKKVGYLPNIIWILIINLYSAFIPIVPDSGLYMKALLQSMVPLAVLYIIYTFLKNVTKKPVYRETYQSNKISIVGVATFILILVYFVSGHFRYFSVSIGSGSMIPSINKGDVVIIDKKFKANELKVGQIIAYKYNSTLIIHRLVEIDKVDNKYYFYTKGDSNNAIDDYIIYENMIVGIVDQKIPYIGLPTVWLNNL